MAKFFKRPDGNYGLIRGSQYNDPTIPPPPVGSEIVEFDDSTNQALLDALSGKNGSSWQDHTIVSGQILRSGVPVTIVADGAEFSERKDFDTQVSAAMTRLGQIKTAADAGLTNVQRDAAIGDLAVILRRVLRIVSQMRALQR